MPINLAPRELLKEGPFWKKAFHWSTTIGRVIIICTQIVVLSAFFARFSLDRRLLDLSEKIKTKRAIIEATSDLEQRFRKTQDSLEVIRTLKLDQKQYSQTLQQLTQKIPIFVTLENINLRDNLLDITARTESGAEFARFLTQLFTWEDLSEVILKSASLDKRGGINFNLGIKVDPDSYQFQLSKNNKE